MGRGKDLVRDIIISKEFLGKQEKKTQIQKSELVYGENGKVLVLVDHPREWGVEESLLPLLAQLHPQR